MHVQCKTEKHDGKNLTYYNFKYHLVLLELHSIAMLICNTSPGLLKTKQLRNDTREHGAFLGQEPDIFS